MMDTLGPIFAITVCILELLAIWRWGLIGLFNHMTDFWKRILYGPKPSEPCALDYAKIARLEHEIWGNER